jgi:TolB-like protein
VTEPTEGEGTAIWDRLRRRKVVQWGIAYAAGAWGFLQGLAYVSSLLNWPGQLQKLTGLALLIGFPVVLVLAWFQGDRGHRRVTRTELAILTLLFLAGGGLFWRYQHVGDRTVPTSASAGVVALPTDRSIAVLPFVNMSPDKDQAYFADGISEELLNLLAQVPQLRVIARTSSFSFKGKEIDIAEIARKLEVANVLEGSVRKSGDKLRITAQLIRAADSSHLWSQTYDRQVADVFTVQDEIARAVVDELKIKLLGAAPKSRETDPRSYVLFLQARDLARKGTPAASKEAIAKYQRSLELDPANILASVGLANTYWSEVYTGWRPPDDGVPLARNLLEKALTLDPEDASARSLLAQITVAYDLDYSEAVRHVERAVARAPRDPDVINAAGYMARRIGRLEQAIAMFEYQVAQDPLNWTGHDDLAYAYWYAGHADKAIAEFQKELVLSPESVAVHSSIAEVFLNKGDTKSALREIQFEPDEQWRLPVLSMVYHASGLRSESDSALAELIQNYDHTAPFSIATVFAFRGENDRAFEWLAKAVQYRDLALGSLISYPGLVKLRSDARWIPFLRKHGMAPEQLAAIKFDVTAPK